MEIQFDLVYEESEPITSMSGNEYIPIIGSDVLFNNIIYDENDDEFTLCFHATVINHFYDTGCDILHIICNVKDKLDETDHKEIREYNKVNKQNKRQDEKDCIK